jgi:hypothetical protein
MPRGRRAIFTEDHLKVAREKLKVLGLFVQL